MPLASEVQIGDVPDFQTKPYGVREFWVSARHLWLTNPIAVDRTSTVSSNYRGVFVHTSQPISYTSSTDEAPTLLDMHPETSTLADAVLEEGFSFNYCSGLSL